MLIPSSKSGSVDPWLSLPFTLFILSLPLRDWMNALKNSKLHSIYPDPTSNPLFGRVTVESSSDPGPPGDSRPFGSYEDNDFYLTDVNGSKAIAVEPNEQVKDVFDQLRDAYQEFYPPNLEKTEQTVSRAFACGTKMMKIIPHATGIVVAAGSLFFLLGILAFRRKKMIINVITPPPQAKEKRKDSRISGGY